MMPPHVSEKYRICLLYHRVFVMSRKNEKKGHGSRRADCIKRYCLDTPFFAPNAKDQSFEARNLLKCNEFLSKQLFFFVSKLLNHCIRRDSTEIATRKAYNKTIEGKPTENVRERQVLLYEMRCGTKDRRARAGRDPAGDERSASDAGRERCTDLRGR